MKQPFFYLIVIVATFLVRENPFFWDTVQLASKHAHFFYESNFQSIILPAEIDSGHPPLFGLYLALVWEVFGKTLPVSHFAMLPFLLGIVYFLNEIGKKLAGPNSSYWLVLLCLADPVLASQSVLVSPDIVLVCCFLMAIWAVWVEKPWLLGLSVIVLGLISTRGMMIGLAIFIFSLVTTNQKFSIQLFLKKLLPFIPGGLVAAGYLIYHWSQTGWIGYHSDSTWAPSFERVSLQGFIGNVGVMGWRFVDFGRVFVWALIVVLGIKKLRSSNHAPFAPNTEDFTQKLIILSIVVFLVSIPTQLLYKGLLAHRYFLPFFLTLNFIAFHFLSVQNNPLTEKWRSFVLPVLCALLFSGNFWIYPSKISMGWDSTLAHLPWYKVSKETENYIRKANIPIEKVGTVFPNIGDREIYELNGEQNGFVEKDFGNNCYVFYSNIMNDFSENEKTELKENWEVVFEQELIGVFTILYKNKNQAECGN